MTDHFVKSVCSRSYYGPHFPAFGLNTERYRVFLRIQSECGKMRTRVIPNTDIFYAVDGNKTLTITSKLKQLLLKTCIKKRSNHEELFWKKVFFLAIWCWYFHRFHCFGRTTKNNRTVFFVTRLKFAL